MYFSNMALGLGNKGPLTDDETIDDIPCEYDDHDSIKYIRNENPYGESFEFPGSVLKKLKACWMILTPVRQLDLITSRQNC